MLYQEASREKEFKLECIDFIILSTKWNKYEKFISIAIPIKYISDGSKQRGLKKADKIIKDI